MKKLFSLMTFLLIVAGAWADYYEPTTIYTQGDAIIYATVVTNELGAMPYSYEVGAFVDDVCIGNAKADRLETGEVIYIIRARGNEDMVGKTIEFRAYNESSRTEFALTPDQNITFQLTGTYGYPSKLVTLTLKAATNYELADIELEVGEEVNLLDYLTMTPSDATFPLNATWNYTSYSSGGNVTIEGNIMNGLAPDRGQIYLYIGTQDFYTCEYQVVKRATAINILTEEFQVNKGQSDKLTRFLSNTWDAAQAYKLTPSDASDDVFWELTDDGIIEIGEQEVEVPGGWTTKYTYNPVKGGTTYVRPYFINKSGTKVYPPNNKWITIKVNVPVQYVSFDTNIIYANVGDDIYQRLLKHLVFTPSDATNQNVTFSQVDCDNLTISGTSVVVNSKGHSGNILVTTEDGGKMASIDFEFLDPLKEVTFAKNPLNLEKNTPIDEAEAEISGNIIGSLEGSQEGIISLSGVLSGSGEKVDNTWIVELSNTELQKGSATVTVTCGWYEYSTKDDGTDVSTLVWGTPKSFIVNIGVSLNGMTVTVTPDTSDPTKGVITLTPDPADADINWADFPVKIDARSDFKDWNCVTIVDNGNGTFNYSSEVPGKYSILPVGGSSTKELDIPLKSLQAKGWQWCSLPQMCLYATNEGGDDFESFFGPDLAEVRTQFDEVINDPSWGLFGSLLNFGIQSAMYKLKMNAAHTGFLHYGYSIGKEYETPRLDPGWNWIECPYFYNRLLSNAIPANQLVKDMVIISKSDGSAQWDGTKWVGDLKALKRGQGYILFLPGTSYTRIMMNDETLMPQGNEDGGSSGAPRHDESPWQYDHTQFADNMTMVATVEGIIDFDRYTIGAFVGDECRGEGEFIDGLAFITVHGNGGEQVSFRLHDRYMGEFFDIDQTVISKTRLGSLDEPVRLSSQGFTDGINTIHVDNGIQGETYDTNGRRLNGLQRGINIVRQSDGTVRKVLKK